MLILNGKVGWNNMKKLLAILICLIMITGCSNNTSTENKINNTTNQKDTIYQEVEKQKDDDEVKASDGYVYKRKTVSLKKGISKNKILQENLNNLENVLICNYDTSIFIYSNTSNINIYSLKKEKAYTKKEVSRFNLSNWCDDKNLEELLSISQREIDYLKK